MKQVVLGCEIVEELALPLERGLRRRTIDELEPRISTDINMKLVVYIEV
jgi:hypothetical protein